MKKSELPLYLKISSIYNKIMQLAIAVIGIVILMNLWLQSEKQQQQIIQQQYSQISQSYLSHATVAIENILEQNNPELLVDYLTALGEKEAIADVHYYDHTGLLIASSANSQTIEQRYHTEFSEPKALPFVNEIRSDKLIGYLRLSVYELPIIESLKEANFVVHEKMRLLIIFALIVGFFLTRGLSRFSRSGLRLSK